MSEKKVLIVDDDPSIRLMFKEMLETEGYKTVIAADGMQAIRFARSMEPDLILLDINMPAGSGEMVYSTLKNMITTSSIPIVIISGESPERIEKLVTDKGIQVDDILLKPVDYTVFMDKISSIFEKTSKSYKKSGKTKILIADDEENFRFLVRSILEDLDNYELSEATTGMELIQKTLEEKPALIISDIMMPDLNGCEAVRKIRKHAEFKNTPVIFISGAVKDKDLYESLKPEGPCEFVVKPFRYKDIMALIENKLSIS